MTLGKMIKKAGAVVLSIALLCTAFAVVPVNAGAAGDDGLLMEFNFDDGKATDSSGNGNDGAVYGTMKEVAGVSGNAMYFSGGYVQLPNIDFSNYTEFSVAAWVCPMATSPYSRVCSFGSSDQTQFDLVAPYNANDSRQYMGSIRVNGVSSRAISSTAFNTDNWRYVVLTYSQANNGLITLYEDGVEVASTVSGKNISDLKITTNNTLGRSQYLDNPDFYGYMDEFQAYTRTLTAEEIVEKTADGTRKLLQNRLDNFSFADYNGLSNLSAVMQDLAVPGDGYFSDCNASTFWRSSNSSVISNDGVIGEVSEPTDVKMTVTLINNSISVRKVFNLTVVPKGDMVVDAVNVSTSIGKQPELPELIPANNGTASVTVVWDTPATSEYANMYAGAGSFEISGTTSAGESIKANVTVDNSLFTNPVVNPPSPDPYITYHDGYYYYVKSSSGINIAKARRLQDIGAAPLVKVYAVNDTYKEFWAPELHYVDGCWYVYAAPTNKEDSGKRGMYALRATDPNDAQSTYEMVGKVTPTTYNESTESWEVNPAEDLYALDGTVLETNGKKFFIYSAHESSTSSTQQIFINEMADASTIVGNRVKLPAGGARFEQMCNIGNSICEGPQVFQHNGKVYVLYSTDMSNHDWYQLCLMYADADSDLLNPDSWTKHPGPVLTKSLNPDDETYAPGHACVVSSPDGTEDWLVYHAYISSSNRTGDQEERCARALKISWEDGNDVPIFDDPVALEEMVEAPSGSADIVALKYEAESAVLSGGASVVNAKRASNKSLVSNIGTGASVTFNVNVPKAGRYLVTLIGCAFDSTNNYQDVNINGNVFTVNYRVTYNGAYRFMGSSLYNSDKVGQGIYTELNEGMNTITVTHNEMTSYLSALDYLYITQDYDIEYTVELDKSAAEITEDETLSLNAVVTPQDRTDNTAVSWTSSDESVATVDANGAVTAVKEGSVTITATLPGGANASCEITVKAPEIAPYLGDIDADGKVTVSDVVALRKIIMSGISTEYQLMTGDVDKNNHLTVSDVVALRKMIMDGGELVPAK